MKLSLFFDILDGFRDTRVRRFAKITPLSNLWGNIGPIVLARGDIIDSRPVAT